MPDSFRGGALRDDSGALVVTGKNGAGVGDLGYHLGRATTDLSVIAPILVPVISGQFTAKAATVPFWFSGSAEILDGAGAWFGHQLFVGPPASSPLIPAVQGAALGSGVVKHDLGSANGLLRGNVAAPGLLTGLTRDTVYAYEVSVAVIGGSKDLSNQGDAPYSIAASKVATAWPERAYVSAVFGANDKRVTINRHKHAQYPAVDERIGSVVLSGSPGAFGRVAVSPDGARAAITTLTDRLWVVTTGAVAGTWTVAEQGSYVIPGTSPTASGVAITSDGVYAWVHASNTDKLHRVRLSDGDMTGDPAWTVGIGAAVQNRRVVLSPDDAFAYVLQMTSGGRRVYKVNLSTGVVTNVQLPSGRTPNNIAISADGASLWVVSHTTHSIHRIRTSDMTVQESATFSTGGVPTAVAAFADGRGLIVANDSTTAHQIKQLNTPSPPTFAQYVSWSGKALTASTGTDFPIHDVAILPTGAIIVPSYNEDALRVFHGGEWRFEEQAAPDFDAQELRILFGNAS